MQIVKEKLLACQKNTSLIEEKLTILKESRRPVLQDIDDIPQQNYQPQQLEMPTREYLKQIEKQHKEINKQVEVINKKAEKIEKQYNKEERKRQDEKLFPKKPIIRTKEQIEQERKAKEDKRLDDFINKIVTKYEPYLKKPEPLKEEQIKAQTIYNEKFKKYQIQKQHQSKIEEGLVAKEKKQFDLVTTKDNWTKTQNRKVDTQGMVEDCIVDVGEMQTEQDEINNKIEREKRKKQQQILFYKLLDEKQKMDQTVLKQNFNTLVTKMFRQMDKQKTGYISKEELLSYLKEYQVFIDIFEINWQPFKEFVIKVKATRKGLLNKAELTEILQDKKLHSKIQDVIDRIKELKKENYELPEFEVEKEALKVEEVEIIKQLDRDPEIDYKQFEELTQLNQEYQDTNFPIYHQDLEQKRIEYENMKKEKKEGKIKHDPNFIAFNNEMGILQEQYNKGNLEFQKSEEFIIDSKFYK